MISAENVNRCFPKYPVTVNDKGWIYGVWYCGTSFTKQPFYGMYPPTFLKRAVALFPGAERILQCPSGTVTGPGITVDAIRCDQRKPMVQATADNLPFRSGTFDLYISDPPYSKEDAAVYGCKPYPLRAAMREARRVLRPGGYFGILHAYYPSYRRKEWKLVALIAVVTGFCRMTRMFSVFERLPDDPQLSLPCGGEAVIRRQLAKQFPDVEWEG